AHAQGSHRALCRRRRRPLLQSAKKLGSVPGSGLRACAGRNRPLAARYLFRASAAAIKPPMPNDPSANEPEFMARLREALALQQQGRLDEAEPIYRAVLSEAPDHFDALHLLGLIHYQRGQFAEAIPLFDRAIQIGPHDLYPHYNRALALDALKRPAEA